MSGLLLPSDKKRTYDLFRLENELHVITISDPTTATSAAALDVKFGSFSDPDDLPGLAHFIEHMLFLGTEKYPVENSYQQFLSDHGGRSNAFTSLENTNFHFDVSSEHFYEALDRFSTFFTCPLFTASAAEREIKAIDSEHSKNMQVDSARFFQFCRDISNPNFPFSKFATGNITTLQTIPTQKGIDTVKRMVEQYQTHYSANLMKLVVYGKESNETMRKWVEQLFSTIPNKSILSPKFDGQPFTDKELQRWYHITPVLSSRSVSLLYSLPIGQEEYLTKELHYLGHLIGHESEGSILHLLKQRSWADGLCAGSGLKGTSWSLFTIDVELTATGMEHVDEIITICCQYIQMLKNAGFQDYVYEELKDISEMQFRFEEPGNPSAYSTSIASAMNTYKLEHSLAGDFLFFERSPERVKKALELLDPSKMIVVLKAKELEPTCDKCMNQYYTTKYAVKPFEPSQLERWTSPKYDPAVLHLPVPNPFIAQNLEIKPLPANAPEHPQVIYQSDSGLMKVWFKQNILHAKPKATVRWNFLSRAAYATPRQRLLNRIFVLVVKEELNVLTYHAECAYLQFDFDATIEGVRISVAGFNDKVGQLSRHIFTHLKDVKVEDALFYRLRDQVKRMVENLHKDHPYQMAMDTTANILHMTRWNDDDLLPIVDKLTPEDLRTYIPSMMNQGRVECYIHGNVLREEAIAMVKEIEADFFGNVLALPSSQLPELRILKIPKGKQYIRPYKQKNMANTNVAVEFVIQVGLTSIRKRLLCDLFACIVETAIFTQLRTVEQLGYVVATFVLPEENVLSIAVVVQSAARDVMYIFSRIYGVFEALEKYLADYSEDEFQTIVKALIATRVEKPKTLFQESDEHWREILFRQYIWDRDEREIAELKTLRKQDVIDLWHTYLCNSAPKGRRLATFVYNGASLKQYEALYEGEKKHDVVSSVSLDLPTFSETPAEATATSNTVTLSPEAMEQLAVAAKEHDMKLEDLSPEEVVELAVHLGLLPPPSGGCCESSTCTHDHHDHDHSGHDGHQHHEGCAHAAADEAEEGQGTDDKQNGSPTSKSLSMDAFNGRTVKLDISYILDGGRFKQTLGSYPFCDWGLSPA